MKLEELLMGGPGIDGYAYNADVYCVQCGRNIIHRCYPLVKDDEDAQRDTESMPQPIFFGESDYRQSFPGSRNCADCGEYLYGIESPETA